MSQTRRRVRLHDRAWHRRTAATSMRFAPTRKAQQGYRAIGGLAVPCGVRPALDPSAARA